MIITLANMLTLSRLVLVPFFIAAFVAGEMGWAFAIFCIAGATDLIDGTVARKFSRPTRWGAIVDPIADKCLVQSCFISLAVVGVESLDELRFREPGDEGHRCLHLSPSQTAIGRSRAGSEREETSRSLRQGLETRSIIHPGFFASLRGPKRGDEHLS